MLDLANSGSSRANRAANLEQALDAVGQDMVRTLLIRESIAQVFNYAVHANDFDLRGFWQHSLMAATIAQMIAANIGYPHVGEAYLAGLLHDVGRLALMRTYPTEYADSIPPADDESLCAHEQRTLHISHPQAGALLISRWGLDSFLADSVLYHHEPSARLEKAHPLIRIGYLAHQLSEDEQDEKVLEALGSLCGVGAAVLAMIRGRAAVRVEKEAVRLGIDLVGSESVLAPVTRPAHAHDPARERLSAKVRDLVIASEAGRSFSRQQEYPKLLETITQCALLLFEFQDVCVFLIDGKQQVLIGAPIGPHQRRLAEFSIPLGADDAIGRAAGHARLTSMSRDGASLGVAEEQLLRMLGTEHMVCVPLLAAGGCQGMLVGGASDSQLPALREREGLLLAFGTQVATALQAEASQRNETSREVAALKSQYLEAARKAAHEANNPLSIITNYLSVLDRKLAKQEPVNLEISILNEEINRVGQIIGRLGDLQPAMPEGNADVNRVVNDVVRLFRDTEFIPPGVRIASRTHDQPMPVEGDADILKQILVNLLKNAAEALASSGEIAIGTNGLVNRDGALFVEIWVKDTGPGIPPEVMANLFFPTRSTKGEGHRGIGLSIVHGLVKQLQGFITCRSDKRGTHFEILLPSAVAAARQHFRTLV
jgi:putative nucleotidyltransferase with HDIG domain